MIADTHAHLADPVFDPDRAEVLRRAREAGVAPVVVVTEDLDEARRAVELAALHPDLRPAAGLYPGRADLLQAGRLADWIRAERGRLVAVGEVGLDHWLAKEEPQREVQREVLRLFARLAAELDLPLNVHSRSAGRATVELLLAEGARRVQLHAFDGRAAGALPAVEAGWFFSIPPSVARSPQKWKLVRALPLSCLLAETDSPVLGAEPGLRNEPAQVVRVVSEIAGLKGVRPEAVREALAENTRRLYGGSLEAGTR